MAKPRRGRILRRLLGVLEHVETLLRAAPATVGVRIGIEFHNEDCLSLTRDDKPHRPVELTPSSVFQFGVLKDAVEFSTPEAAAEAACNLLLYGRMNMSAVDKLGHLGAADA